MRKLFLFLFVLPFFLCLTGCSQKETVSTLGNLEEGKYYIYNPTYGTCEELYMPENTFEDAIVTSPSTDRIIWDNNKLDGVPYLYGGAQLIYYTPKDFSELFYWERFYDLGYTIGVRNLSYLASGRVYLSTETNKKLTYPGGDTDALNNFRDNDYVVIDSIGGIELRQNTLFGNVNKYGLLTGLTVDKSYAAVVYNGTVKNEFTFCANIRALGSAETYVSMDYEYITGDVIEIAIPNDWNSGIYMINGVGVFFYCNESSSDPDNLNIPNQTKIGWIDDEGNTTVLSDSYTENSANNKNDGENTSDEEKSSLNNENIKIVTAIPTPTPTKQSEPSAYSASVPPVATTVKETGTAVAYEFYDCYNYILECYEYTRYTSADETMFEFPVSEGTMCVQLDKAYIPRQPKSLYWAFSVFLETPDGKFYEMPLYYENDWYLYVANIKTSAGTAKIHITKSDAISEEAIEYIASIDIFKDDFFGPGYITILQEQPDYYTKAVATLEANNTSVQENSN